MSPLFKQALAWARRRKRREGDGWRTWAEVFIGIAGMGPLTRQERARLWAVRRLVAEALLAEAP